MNRTKMMQLTSCYILWTLMKAHSNGNLHFKLDMLHKENVLNAGGLAMGME
jgi:hypothetical protein